MLLDASLAEAYYRPEVLAATDLKAPQIIGLAQAITSQKGKTAERSV